MAHNRPILKQSLKGPKMKTQKFNHSQINMTVLENTLWAIKRSRSVSVEHVRNKKGQAYLAVRRCNGKAWVLDKQGNNAAYEFIKWATKTERPALASWLKNNLEYNPNSL